MKRRIIVKIENSLDYETVNPLRKIFNLVWIPFLNTWPNRVGRKIFAWCCKHCREVQAGATTWRALEAMYTYNGKLDLKNGLKDGIFTYFWEHNMMNAQAVRNRLKLVKKELKKAIFSLAKSEVNILSLGSGSARAVIEVIAEMKDSSVGIKAKFIDMSRDALTYSRALAEEYGVAGQMQWVRSNVLKIEKFCNSFTPDIVEMVGFLPYLSDGDAIEIVKKIYKALPPSGVLITNNTKDNIEAPFAKKIVGYRMMCCRDEKELGEILMKGGFNSIKILVEPLRIHPVAVATKLHNP